MEWQQRGIRAKKGGYLGPNKSAKLSFIAHFWQIEGEQMRSLKLLKVQLAARICPGTKESSKSSAFRAEHCIGTLSTFYGY